MGPMLSCNRGFLALLSHVCVVAALALHVQPIEGYAVEARGWAETKGGRGGRIIRVTNLSDAGPGSYRAAVEASDPRIVVFEVGGVIDGRGGKYHIRNPYLTIAGQTAPPPGITVIKAETIIATHDVIIQHMMFRPGEFGRPKKSGGDQDGISTGGGAYNVIVDHCSLSWASDENLSASGPRFDGRTPEEWRKSTSHNITFSHNLIYEGLSNSVHAKGEHSKGTLVHDNITGIFLYANVYASNRERNALFKGGVYAAMVNNLIYNPGAKAVHYNLVAHEWGSQPHQTGKVTLIGNVLRYGPDTKQNTPLFSLGGHGDVELFLEDNIAQDDVGKAVALTGRYTSGEAKILNASKAYLPGNTKIVRAVELEQKLLDKVGARPWARDPIDSKLLSDIAEGRGKIIDSEADPDAMGFPTYIPTSKVFDPNAWNLDDMSPKAGWGSLRIVGRR
jgi:hypothetical protein